MKELFSQIDGLYQQADLPAVEEKLTGALKKLEKQGKERSPEYAQVANELAGFYRGVSRYPESLHFFQTAMELLDQAEEGFLSAKGRMERLNLRDGYVYHSILNNLSLVYQMQGRLEQAEQLAEQSLVWNRKQERGAHEVATALNNLAVIRQKRGDWNGAQQLLAEALALYDQMAEPNVHHAAALETHAVLCLKQGDWDGAMEGFQRAREKTELFFGRNIEYAIACENIAVLYARKARWDEAMAEQEKAIAIKERVAGPDSEAAAEARRLLQKMRDRKEGR